MTQDEIIVMAREAGFKMENSAAIQAAEIFANLVAAKEREALAQTQEPVAWMTQARNFIHLSESTEAEAKLYGWKAVYTNLQRTWVGLAAEDRLTAKYMQDAPDGIEAVIDYIEAKLKEKNT